jgi:hypothetical protein
MVYSPGWIDEGEDLLSCMIRLARAKVAVIGAELSDFSVQILALA